jgi:hypothetical protein
MVLSNPVTARSVRFAADEALSLSSQTADRRLQDTASATPSSHEMSRMAVPFAHRTHH